MIHRQYIEKNLKLYKGQFLEQLIRILLFLLLINNTCLSENRFLFVFCPFLFSPCFLSIVRTILKDALKKKIIYNPVTLHKVLFWGKLHLLILSVCN